MKKKVLSALLAVALFVGLAVPAFAEFPSSSQSGTDDEITALAFAKESYTIENGGTKDLAAELTAYVGKDKVVQSPAIEWSISDSIAFGIDENGVVSNIGEDKGTATVTAKSTETGKTVTAKVVAAKSSFKKATGFKFAKTKFTIVAGQTGQEVVIAPTPSGASFSDEQIKQLNAAMSPSEAASRAAVAPALTIKDSKGDAVTDIAFSAPDKVNGDGELVYTVDATDVTAKKDCSVALDLDFLKYDSASSDDGTYSMNRTTKLAIPEGVQATKVIKTGSVTVEVGKTADLMKAIGFGPSNSNYNKSVTWEMALYNDDATTEDYAVLGTGDDANTIKGIAVGKCKAVATLNYEKDGNKTSVAEVTVNVVARGSIAENAPKLSLTTATLEVGGTQYVTVANVPENAEVKWTVDNDNATIVAATNAAKIFAKKVGTAKVTCTVDGTEVGTIEVTVKAASTTTPSKPGATDNPQTGDSIFAGLF